MSALPSARDPFLRAALFLLIGAAPAVGQRPGRVEIGPDAGVAVFLGALPDSFRLGGADGPVVAGAGLNDAALIGGHLDVWLSRWLALEANGVFVPSRLHGGGSSASVDVAAFTLGARAARAETGRFRPFAAVGLGVKRYDFTGPLVGHASHFAAVIGAGFTFGLAPDVRLRLEARDCMSIFTAETDAPSPTQHDLLLSIGVDLAVLLRGGAAARR